MRVARVRQRKKTHREKKENKLNQKENKKKSSGKIERVMAEIRASINRSTFLSPRHSHSLGSII